MKQFLLILSLACLSGLAFAQQTDKANSFPKTITVSGSAEMEIIPDEIYVIVDLREYDKRGQGKVDIETIKSAFLQKCKDLGLPDSTITIATYEGYSNPWLRKKKKADLYASISYQIKFTKSNDIDKLVDKLDDDATQNFRIVKTTHSNIKEFRKQLKILAIKAAKEKGLYLTEAIDEKLGEAVTITEFETPTGYYNFFANQYQFANSYSNTQAAGPGNSDTAADFNKIKLHYEVNVVFALK